MLSIEKLKDFLILILTFGIIYWFQQVDDKKRCKNRDGIYDNIKLPLLVTAIVGLVLFWEKTNILTLLLTSEPTITNLPTTTLPTATLPTTNLPTTNLPTTNLPNTLPTTNLPPIKDVSQFGGNYPLEMNMNGELDVFTEMAEW